MSPAHRPTRGEHAAANTQRDAMDERLQLLGHAIEWRLGPNAGRKGHAYFYDGQCRHCGATVSVGSTWSSCSGIRDARSVRCGGPGTKVLTDIEEARARELFAQVVREFGIDVARARRGER